MAELRDVVLRLKLGHGVRAIARQTGIHRKIVREIRALAESLGWLEATAELPSEHQIEEARRGGDGEATRLITERLEAHLADFQRWIAERHTYTVMHELIRDQVPCSLSTLSRFVKSRFAEQAEAVMRRQTSPGEVMEVDFGYLGVSWDPESGHNRKTWVFSGRLRHSRRAWRERCFDQKARTFFLCHIHALEHFGGVVARVTPDNLKAAVVEASFQQPIINRAYRALAEHYGFLIDPCAPYSPEHKGGVESDIKYIKRNFWPLFRERQRQHGHEVPHADELEEALGRWGEEVADKRLVGGVGRSPQEIFQTEEAEALKPLPATRWDPLSWGEPTVGPDWRVQFEKGFYSVPYQYIGAKVLVYGNSSGVRIYTGTLEIALHGRVQRPWGSSIKAEHAPPHKLDWLSADRNGLLKRAYQLSQPVGELAKAIFADKAVDGMRPVRALLRLADRYSVERLTAGCSRALLYDTPQYRSVKEILVRGLDRLPLSQPASGQLSFRFQREQGYFDPAQHVG